MHVSNARASIFMKKILLKLKSYISSHTLIVGDFHPPLSPMNKSYRQKLNSKILKLIDSMNQKDLTDIYRTFHPNTKE